MSSFCCQLILCLPLLSADVPSSPLGQTLSEADDIPERVAEAASPIDDVRGTARYRRHALQVLTSRALVRCLT